MRDYSTEFYNYFMALANPQRYAEAPTAGGLYGKWPGLKEDARGYLWPEITDPTPSTDPEDYARLPEMVDYYMSMKKAQEQHIPYASEPGHMAMIDGKFQDVYLYHKAQERKKGIQANDDEQGGAMNISPPTSVRLRWDLENLMALMQGSGRTGGM